LWATLLSKAAATLVTNSEGLVGDYDGVDESWHYKPIISRHMELAHIKYLENKVGRKLVKTWI
jgi:hypothetical protein